MENLIVAMLRFSAAVTLYGMEQIQSTMNIVEGGEDLSKTMEKFEKTLNSVTEALMNKVDETKKETLKSVTKMSQDVVSRSMDGINLMDPREVLRATTDLMQKTSDATAEWVSKAASVVEKTGDAAKPSEKGKSK